MGVLFNFIPGSGLVAPGTFFERNSKGTFEGLSWTLVLGHKSSPGSLAANTPTVCTNIAEAAALCGNGSQLYETFRKIRRAAPAAVIYVAHVPVTGTPPVWTVTVGTVPAAGGSGIIEIAGRKINVNVSAGDSATIVAASIAAAVNAWQDPLTRAFLPVTASATTNVVTLTARHAGATMNEIEVYVDGALSGNLFTTSWLTIAQSVVGTGTADVSGALAAMGDLPFHWVISPFGDAANIAAASTAFSDATGRWSYLQQLYGHYITVATGSTSQLTTLGLAQNDDHITMLGRFASPTPSWEFLAGLIARVIPWLSDSTNGNAARNQTGLAAEDVRAPRDPATWPKDYNTRNALLQSGISTWKVNASGEAVIDKLITTRRLNSAGQIDTTFRDIQTMAQAVHFLTYMRAGLSYRHTNKSVADSNPAGLPTVSTTAQIRSDCIQLYGDTVGFGLMENLEQFAATLVVERDLSNRRRINIGMNDVDPVNPLDIIAANATFKS